VGRWAQDRFGNLRKKWDEQKRQTSTVGNFGSEAVRAARTGYFAAITHIDEQVGRLVEGLKKRGDLENTLICFTADHGDMMGDNYLWRKTYAYEPSARVPMIVRWGERFLRARRGQVLSQVVELRDVLPTFLDAAGIAVPEPVEGESMLQLVRGRNQDWREFIDLEHADCYRGHERWNALTDGEWKYIYFAPRGREQLFNLDDDPYELRDLAGEPAYAQELARWRNRMIAHLKCRGPEWVKDNDLVVGRKNLMHSPNFNQGTI